MPNSTITYSKEDVTTAYIPLSFMRFLEKRENERVLEIVVVYQGVDRWDTIIDPTGMRTDPSVVMVDYNHKGVATGAYVRNFRVIDNYELEDGTILETALIADLHVPKDSEMFYFDPQGSKKSNGSLYEAVNRGQAPSVSVEFKPPKGKQITDRSTGITTYREWDLIGVSLLDISPGQPYSGYKIIRSQLKNMNLNQIITAKLASLPEPIMTEDVSIVATFMVDGKEHTATIQVGETLEDVTVTPAEMREGEVIDLPEEPRGYEGDEELRATVTELKTRMEEMEKSMVKPAPAVDPADDKAEESRIRALSDSARTKTEPIAGDAKRQLGDNENTVKTFTIDDMTSEVTKSHLKNY